MTFYKWRPLEGIDLQTITVDFQEIDSLHRQWVSFRKEREASNPNAYKAFLERVYRSWAIETGIIEGIYAIDRGTTQTLVENGLRVDLIERGSTDRDPHELVEILKDHQDSAAFVTDYIRSKRPFSKHYIRELHQLLTRSQPTYTAVDQFGNVVETPLDRGGFKKQPNNPTRSDGLIHEYCPPIQVDSELDRLVELYSEFEKTGSTIHNLLVAAWLHHRFAQVHPFQDGNGRVARALLTWHLAKGEYLPIVISRDDRKDYIDYLEMADAGNLNPFVAFIVSLERRVILDALGQPEPLPDSRILSQVLGHIAEQVRHQNQDRLAELRMVNDVARSLQDGAKVYLQSHVDSIQQSLEEAGLSVTCLVDIGGPGDREHWYRTQVVQTAQATKHWVNLNESRFFVKLSINPQHQTLTPRLVFVISLHHVGRQLAGIMAAIAFAQIVSFQDYTTEESQESADLDFKNCTMDSFTFTWQDNPETVQQRFLTWIEESLSIGLRHWSESMS